MSKKKPCVKCSSFEKIAENMGYCRKYGFNIWLDLAKRDKVCEGME